MESAVSLMELFKGVPDPRRAQGRRHPLSALLLLAVVGLLSGMTSYEAIVDFGKERGEEFLQLLGFTRRRGLCKAISSRVFRRLEVADVEARIDQWIQGQLRLAVDSHIAIDGKMVRGSRDVLTPGFTWCPRMPLSFAPW
jgi:hypothetical protein